MFPFLRAQFELGTCEAPKNHEKRKDVTIFRAQERQDEQQRTRGERAKCPPVKRTNHVSLCHDCGVKQYHVESDAFFLLQRRA